MGRRWNRSRSTWGDVADKRVLQLACSTGDEVISWAQRGASVHGVDISEMHIDKARAKAAAVGVACDLRVADMFDLPADLTGLNLVCIPLGGICWPPDIDAWARVVAERLRPGGRVLTSERHPIWEVVTVSREQLADRTG